MSLTPERLDELALEVVKTNPDCVRKYVSPEQVTVFARALLAAVEAELKPVAESVKTTNGYVDYVDLRYRIEDIPRGTKLISLPLIKEKSSQPTENWLRNKT